MKTERFQAVLGLLLAAACVVRAAEPATVKRDKVNLRGQPSFKGEVITQLAKGEPLVVLEEIEVKGAKKGEPAKWAKVLLPANSTVWVFAPYISADAHTVTVSRVNVRGGRGENFSVLGRLERGAAVKEIRTVDNWMEIEAPTNAYAFVATEFLEKGQAFESVPATAPNVAATTPPTTTSPAPAPTTVTTIPSEPPPFSPADESKPKPAAEPPPAPVVTPRTEPAAPSTPAATETSTVAQVEPPAETAPLPKRIVIREGRVVYSRSIQAPTTFALESPETHRLINYLHTETEGLNVKAFAGRKVVVTGEELLDARWAYTPILEVQDIRIAR